MPLELCYSKTSFFDTHIIIISVIWFQVNESSNKAANKYVKKD